MHNGAFIRNPEVNPYILTSKDNLIEISNSLLNLTEHSTLNSTYEYMDKLHLNKGRGFGIYSASNFTLLKSNRNYDEFLAKQYGCDKCSIGKTLNEISKKNKNTLHYSLFQKTVNTGETICLNNFELINYRHTQIFLDVTYIPIYENNTILYVVESFSDVTELQHKNKEILSYQKQKEFFSFICHEFKTPLTVTLSAIQAIMVICKDDLSANSLKYLKKIKQSSLQQWELVTSLLDILKSDSGYLQVHKKNLDITKVTKAIVDTVSEYAITKGINIIFSSSLQNEIIGIDDEKYERILLNLLSNAIKYTPYGNSIYVTLSLKNDKINLTVKDTGIGIPKDQLDSIFQIFSQVDNSLTRKSDGTGIGLYLVKQLVTAMEGEVHVSSTPNIGSSFTVTLPSQISKEEYPDFNSFNISNDRLVEVTNIEFSTIYFD